MTLKELADKILAEYEDNHEYHFHQVDREWLIKAMCKCALIFNNQTL